MKDFLISASIILGFTITLFIVFLIKDVDNRNDKLPEVVTCELRSPSPLKTVCVNGTIPLNAVLTK